MKLIHYNFFNTDFYRDSQNRLQGIYKYWMDDYITYSYMVNSSIDGERIVCGGDI